MITKEKSTSLKYLIAELHRTIKFALQGCGNTTAVEIDLMTNSIKKAREMTIDNCNDLDIYGVCEELGLSKPSIYKWIERGWLPKPTKISKNSAFWRKEDVEEAKKYLKDYNLNS
jgi:predicted DNA-binding transcriptional regulator AlpA